MAVRYIDSIFLAKIFFYFLAHKRVVDMRYRKKPIVIEAIRWSGENFSEVTEFCEGAASLEVCSNAEDNFKTCTSYLRIDTSEGVMRATIGDYIIKEPFDKERGFYPCKPDIFKQTYDAV